MNVSRTHEGDDSYLIIGEEPAGEKEAFSLRMITENQIPGLLPAHSHRLNDENQIYYRISGMTSLEELCGRKQMQQKQLKDLLLGLKAVLGQLEEYLLDADNLLLAPSFIYASTIQPELCFCLYPCERTNLRIQIRSLAEYLLEHIDNEDEQVVGMTYQLYRMTREENFAFSQIVEELIKEKSDIQDLQKEEPFSLQSAMGNPQPDCISEAGCAPPAANLHSGANRTALSLSALLPQKKPAGSRLLSWLAAGSFVFFVYTCGIKSYYYGYTFSRILTMKETVCSFVLFLCFLLAALLAQLLSRRQHGAKEPIDPSGCKSR